MDILWVLLGIVIGVVIAAGLLRSRERIDRNVIRQEIAETYDARAAAERARTVRAYERQIQQLQEEHRSEVTYVRRNSVDRSRAVLKGKMAEQMAPLLPGFTYWPADARFLGDPIDYVVFDGYSACKDNHTDGSDIEVVILDIKQGKSRLTREQRRIAEAVAAGRVRFEVVRVLADGTILSTGWGSEATPDGSGEDADRAAKPPAGVCVTGDDR